jgi:hypothetical protein
MSVHPIQERLSLPNSDIFQLYRGAIAPGQLRSAQMIFWSLRNPGTMIGHPLTVSSDNYLKVAVGENRAGAF